MFFIYVYKKHMAHNRYKVDYYLVYENGAKNSQSTTLLMESDSEYEAIQKIKSSNNLTSNVRDIQIIRLIQD